MERIPVTPRPDYREKIEQLGFDFHASYWKEEAYYRLRTDEVNRLEQATTEAYRMMCEAAHVIIEERPQWMEQILKIPPHICRRIRYAWEQDEPSLYGRFDFLIAPDGMPKILEFNADTPTSLLEASLIQWQWKEELFAHRDQYNSIHEALVQSWKDMYKPHSNIHFVGALGNSEDTATLQYLASTAMEAGLSTRVMDIADMNLDEGHFYDPGRERVTDCFKLYPWEWMINESEVGCLADIQWIEPIWKAVMSNKAILTVLYELFPNSPYVLPSFLSRPQFGIFCKKPVYSREGHNVSIVEVQDWNEQTRIAETEGDYGEEGFIYQAYVKPTSYQGRYPIIGSWVIGGEPAGIGIRENTQEITDNLSEFVPHVF